MKVLASLYCCLVLAAQNNNTGYPDPMSQPSVDVDAHPEKQYQWTPSSNLVSNIFHLVLEDGGPPTRTPDIRSGSCGGVSIHPNGVATIATLQGSSHCSATVSLAGLQSVRLDTSPTRQPIIVIMRRVGAGMPSGTAAPDTVGALQPASGKIPVLAHKAYGEGEIAMGLGQWAEAAKCFRRAVADDPQHALALDELGVALENLNQPADAEAAWQKARAADPELGRACIHLAIAAIREQHMSDAAGFTDCAIRSTDATRAEAWFYDAVVNLSLGRLSRAQSSAMQTIRLDGDHVYVRAEYVLGIALAEQRDFNGGIAHLQTYLRLHPQGEFAAPARQRLAEIQAAARK